MVITRDQMIRDLADKCQYYQKDIKRLLHGMDELVKEYVGQVSEDNEVVIQLVEGLKLICKPIEARIRRNPSTNEAFMHDPSCQLNGQFSANMKQFSKDAFIENMKKKKEEQE